MMMPATLSLLRLTFTTDKERGQAIGIWAAVFSGGVAIGPLIGGALLNHFWWGSVFLINVPVVVLALIFTPFIVPAGSRNPERQLDLLNSLLAMVAMVTLFFLMAQQTWFVVVAYFLLYQATNRTWSGAGYAYQAESFPTRIRGTAVGFLSAMQVLGFVFGSILWTVLTGFGKPALTWLIVATAASLGMWTTVLLRRIPPGQELEAIVR
jgi:MFS family permease